MGYIEDIEDINHGNINENYLVAGGWSSMKITQPGYD